MSYQNGLNYLASKTRVVELYNQLGARLTVCPDWNGRVMSSTCDGLDGSSFGFINVHYIDSPDGTRSFCSYGGEDDLLLLFDYFEEGPFRVEAVLHDQEVQMQRCMRWTDRDKTPFNLNVERTVRLLDNEDVRAVFGHEVAVAVEQDDVSYVAFETVNTLFSDLESLSMCTGSMFNAGPSKVAIIPFGPGSNDEEPTFSVEYFGSSPHGRLRQLPGVFLLRADGKSRCQINVAHNLALPLVASIDFREGILTLIAHNAAQTPDWLEEEMIAEKNVVHAYNSGPGPGEAASDGFYMFVTNSPAPSAQYTEKGLVHNQYTMHINADNMTLAYLVDHLFGIDYELVYRKMMD